MDSYNNKHNNGKGPVISLYSSAGDDDEVDWSISICHYVTFRIIFVCVLYLCKHVYEFLTKGARIILYPRYSTQCFMTLFCRITFYSSQKHTPADARPRHSQAIREESCGSVQRSLVPFELWPALHMTVDLQCIMPMAAQKQIRSRCVVPTHRRLFQMYHCWRQLLPLHLSQQVLLSQYHIGEQSIRKEIEAFDSMELTTRKSVCMVKQGNRSIECHI